MRKIITVTDQQADWIKSQIDAGLDTNDNECIRDLIRREQKPSVEVEAIRDALHQGENSGEPHAFDYESLKQRMLTSHG
ncbi:type II toxin-antitoxin system ParD family antitoxin [Pseudomonas sp. FSL R10-1350]|uniref:ribbon-helix-helix domain-containing protein n=1 Tax=Pseudomonas sp. FSL R10-1350 TaxID=2662197 RepID=UPI000F4D1C70|nr:type II toxin-antitoxin system ParD family antitoxin [Pseudomonas sp. FSL R10-1350]MQU62297.1 type II toxin-antitoxin system ParD family antitoxin [Pseudomonas sp. FSL R10-1350]